MALTINAKTYNLDSHRSADSVRYTGPNHTLSVKDYVDLKRTPPKPTATSAGRGKASYKMTRLLTDGTDPLEDGILEIAVSFPVGAASSEVQSMITDSGTWVLTASADDLFEDQDVNQ